MDTKKSPLIRNAHGCYRCFGGLNRVRLPSEADALKSETATGGCPNEVAQVHIWLIRKRHGFRCRRSMSFVLRVSFRVSSRAEFAPGVCHIGCPMCGFSMGGSGALTRRIRSWGVPECGPPSAHLAHSEAPRAPLSQVHVLCPASLLPHVVSCEVRSWNLAIMVSNVQLCISCSGAR